MSKGLVFSAGQLLSSSGKLVLMWLKSRVVPIILDSLPSKAAVVSAHTPNYHFERNSQTPVLDHALFESSDQFVHPDVCRAKTLLQGESELSERCKVQNIKSGITSHVNKGQISKYFQEKKMKRCTPYPLSICTHLRG